VVILYIKATVVSVCGDKQGRVGAGQGSQGRHPPTGPTSDLQQPSRWSSCSANIFFLLSSPAYVSSPSLTRVLSRSLSSHGRNSLQNSTDLTSSFRFFVVFVFYCGLGGRGWGWGSRGLNRWKWTKVGNVKDRVGGIDGVHYASGSH